MKTTEMLAKQEYQRFEEPCHGGIGPWIFKDYLSPMNTRNSLIRFIHDDILPPGSAFGVHKHEEPDTVQNEEWYLCLAGHGIMILDGKEVPFGEGEINVCRNGGAHGIRNTGDTDMRILVIGARAAVK